MLYVKCSEVHVAECNEARVAECSEAHVAECSEAYNTNLECVALPPCLSKL